MKQSPRPSLLLSLLMMLALAGCGGSGEADKEKDKDTKTSAQAASEEELDLAHLSPEDQALKQKICPVGGDLLGSGGMKTVKISVEGREVFLCCEGCESAIREEPKKYFAILDGKQDESAASTKQ